MCFIRSLNTLLSCHLLIMLPICNCKVKQSGKLHLPLILSLNLDIMFHCFADIDSQKVPTIYVCITQGFKRKQNEKHGCPDLTPKLNVYFLRFVPQVSELDKLEGVECLVICVNNGFIYHGATKLANNFLATNTELLSGFASNIQTGMSCSC